MKHAFVRRGPGVRGFIRRILLLSGTCLLPLSAVAGDVHVGMSSSWRQWRVDGGSNVEPVRLWELATPWVAAIEVSDGLDLVLSSAYVMASAKQEPSDPIGLEGWTSFSGQVFWRSPGRRLLVQLGAAPEGGRRRLGGQEYALLETLRQPVLGFDERHLGQGRLWSAGMTWLSEPTDRLRWSLGLGGVRREAYQLVATDGRYLPASEVSASAGLTHSVPGDGGASVKRSLGLTLRLLGQDRIGGNVVYREGVQGEIRAECAWSGPMREIATSLRAIVGSRSQAFLAAFPGEPPATLRPLRVLAMDASYLLPGRVFSWGIAGHADLGLGAERPVMSGVAASLGPVVDVRVSPTWKLRIECGGALGRLDAYQEGLPADLTGGFALLELEYTRRGDVARGSEQR